MEITNEYFQDNNGNNVVVNCQINGSHVSVPTIQTMEIGLKLNVN